MAEMADHGSNPCRTLSFLTSGLRQSPNFARLEELGRPDGDPEFEAAFDRMVALKQAIPHEDLPMAEAMARLCRTLDELAVRSEARQAAAEQRAEPEIIGFGDPDPR